jgi:signal transduction histidine kinase
MQAAPWERLTRLLTDLRKLSDLEERPIERIPVDVPDLLEDVVEAARALPAYAGRNINLLIHESALSVSVCDRRPRPACSGCV